MPAVADPITRTSPNIFLDEDSRIESLYPRSVILYNDDVNEFAYVIQSLRRSVQSLTAQEAEGIAIEAHEKGRSLVISCKLEEAEYYSERLGSCGLTTSIE